MVSEVRETRNKAVSSPIYVTNPLVGTIKESTMPKETTHRDPAKRAARIESRAKKRADTVARKKIMRSMKTRAVEDA